jgi:hypothetical protein
MEFNGIKSTPLGEVKVEDEVCMNCGSKGTTSAIISGKYFHVLWIPALSLGKEVSTKCSHCGKEYQGVEKFNTLKSNYKTPWNHWLFSILLLALVSISFLFNITGNSDEDPRMVMVENDLKVLDSVKVVSGDSLGQAMQSFFNTKTTKKFVAGTVVQMDPSEFSYYTKRNTNKVLLLVKMPSLGALKEDNQGEYIDLVKEFISSNKSIQGKEIYAGIAGSFDLSTAITPTSEEKGSYMSQIVLCDFYGSKVVKK